MSRMPDPASLALEAWEAGFDPIGDRAGLSPCDHHARHAPAWHRVQTGLTQARKRRAGATPERGSRRSRRSCRRRSNTATDCGCKRATLAPGLPIKCHPSTQGTLPPEGVIRSRPRSRTLTKQRPLAKRDSIGWCPGAVTPPVSGVVAQGGG